MQFKTLFLLIGYLSITNADGKTMDQIHEDVKWSLENERGILILSYAHNLTLLDECIGSSSRVLVWRATLNGKEVAVKFFADVNAWDRESKVYQALNAIDNPEIEGYGIPNRYHIAADQYSQMFGAPSIVMTLFDESLFSRWNAQKNKFNIYSTLQVFLQSVKSLKYLQKKQVVHNDIKPRNIFLRGSRVFIGGFDLATLDGEHNTSDVRREDGTAMDDLKALVFTIWYIEHIDSSIQYFNSRSLMSDKTPQQREHFVLEKCEHFAKFSEAYKACVFICKDELLSHKSAPDYDRIIDHLEAAINQVEAKTGQTQFEWLRSSESLP